MAKAAATATTTAKEDFTEIIHLLPEEISVDERFNMRPYSSKQETEDTEIDKLAARIEAVGQLDTCIVVPNPKDAEDFIIYSGHRRRRAIALINQRKSASGVNGLVKVRCVVDRTGGDVVQKAFAANWDRKDMTAMDTALLINLKRKEFGPDAKGTAGIAKQLGVDKATVSQYEKLLTPACSETLRHQLHSGLVKMDTALEIIRSGVAAEDQPALIERAQLIQVADDVERISNKKVPLAEKQKQADKAEKKAKTQVEKPAVRKAIKESNPEAVAKPTFKEVKEFFQSLVGPAYGYPDGAVQQFLAYFQDKFLEGKGTERTLLDKFDRMVENADKGTKESLKEVVEETTEKKASKPAPKPAPAKAVATKKPAKAAAAAKKPAPSKKKK